MPRYHFDTECGEERYEDRDGVELESIDQAKQQLVGLLRDITFYHDDIRAMDRVVIAQVRCESSVVLQGSCHLTVSQPTAWSPKL